LTHVPDPRLVGTPHWELGTAEWGELWMSGKVGGAGAANGGQGGKNVSPRLWGGVFMGPVVKLEKQGDTQQPWKGVVYKSKGVFSSTGGARYRRWEKSKQSGAEKIGGQRREKKANGAGGGGPRVQEFHGGGKQGGALKNDWGKGGHCV